MCSCPPGDCPRSQPVRVEEDISVDLSGLGGAVYSTGLEDVWVRLFSQKLYSGDGLHSGDGDVPYFSWIYLFATNRQTWLTNTEICLGSNHEDEDKFIKLGRLPAGEIRIRVQNTVEGNIVETGTASRNPDGLRHATVRKIPDGVVEVRFEHSPGLTEARLMSGTHLERLRAHNHFFHDCILQFGGGVTLDPTVFTLLTMSKDTDPEKRKVAKTALKQIHPNIARSAGIP
jgi:hypothetical protein